MSPSNNSLLESFHQFVGKQLQSPSTTIPPTPEQVLALWREEQDTLAAIKQGLLEMEAGEGIPLDEFDRQIREKFGFEAQR